MTTPVGTMTLSGYLPTRTFELVVHGHDLASTLGVSAPPQLAEPARSCLRLAMSLAVEQGAAGDVLLALTGRGPLPPGFSVL